MSVLTPLPIVLTIDGLLVGPSGKAHGEAQAEVAGRDDADVWYLHSATVVRRLLVPDRDVGADGFGARLALEVERSPTAGGFSDSLQCEHDSLVWQILSSGFRLGNGDEQKLACTWFSCELKIARL